MRICCHPKTTASVDHTRRTNGKYKIDECIASGGYDVVYCVTDRNGRQYPAKFVKRKFKSLLEQEGDVILLMTGIRYYGNVYKYFFGLHGKRYVSVMDLLGKSVWDLYDWYLGFCLKTVLMLGIQITHRLWELHDRGFVHRDVKPDKFVVGRGFPDSKIVYLIDYGFAQKHVDDCGEHKAESYGHHFVCTSLFASKYSHRGERQSRRSDLESVVYLLIYLLRATLPWKGTTRKKTEKLKETIAAGALCNGVPSASKCYYRAVRNLGYSERPDYERLIAYLESAMRKHEYATDYRFEWTQLQRI